MLDFIRHYTFKAIAVGLVISILICTFLAYKHIIEPKTVKDLSGTLVSVGITLGGFFLTALSILAGFAGTSLMQHILDMEEAYKEMLRTFFATILANLLLAVVALACAVAPLNPQYPGWKTPASLFPFASSVLLVLSLILTSTSLHGFYLVLRGIPKK